MILYMFIYVNTDLRARYADLTSFYSCIKTKDRVKSNFMHATSHCEVACIKLISTPVDFTSDRSKVVLLLSV